MARRETYLVELSLLERATARVTAREVTARTFHAGDRGARGRIGNAPVPASGSAPPRRRGMSFVPVRRPPRRPGGGSAMLGIGMFEVLLLAVVVLACGVLVGMLAVVLRRPRPPAGGSYAALESPPEAVPPSADVARAPGQDIASGFRGGRRRALPSQERGGRVARRRGGRRSRAALAEPRRMSPACASAPRPRPGKRGAAQKLPRVTPSMRAMTPRQRCACSRRTTANSAPNWSGGSTG